MTEITVGSAVHVFPAVAPTVNTRPDRCVGVTLVLFVPGAFVAHVT